MSEKSATPHATLGDETFMSADELRDYMRQVEIAKTSRELEAMDSAARARREMIEKLSEPVALTPEILHALAENLRHKVRLAAERNESEIMLMRFPHELCTDKGRALNNGEEGWPETLTGRPRQAYEIWRDHLKDAHYKLKAMIIDWPNGMPGDVGMFLSWA